MQIYMLCKKPTAHLSFPSYAMVKKVIHELLLKGFVR